MKRLLLLAAAVAWAFGVSAVLRTTGLKAQSGGAVAADIVDKAIRASWTATAPDWQKRLEQDELQKICTANKNNPSPAVANEITKLAQASILYPVDGKLLGDWKKGEALAQNGYGMRFTDTDTTRPNGGNCYACHQINKAELSYGTLGPSLLEYGKIRKFAEADTKAAYEKIYNSHAALPCSQMPRFGAAGVLKIEDITHLVALLMDPNSPTNK
jgi:L-cysteine S-thiosulfotransferase